MPPPPPPPISVGQERLMHRRAGFGIRLAAWSIDVVVIGAITFVVAVVIDILLAGANGGDSAGCRRDTGAVRRLWDHRGALPDRLLARWSDARYVDAPSARVKSSAWRLDRRTWIDAGARAIRCVVCACVDCGGAVNGRCSFHSGCSAPCGQSTAWRCMIARQGRSWSPSGATRYRKSICRRTASATLGAVRCRLPLRLERCCRGSRWAKT